MNSPSRIAYPILIAVACLFAAGCANTRPVHYYTLGSESTHPAPPKTDGPTLVVGNIIASEALQDDRIRYRSDHEVGNYEYHHWTERPATLIRDELLRALRASGKYQRVLETANSPTGDYVVHGHVHKFEEVDGPSIQTKISLQLMLVDRKTNLAVWDHHFEREEPAAGKTIKDVVDSMDRNLQQVAMEAAAEVDRFISQQH